MIRLIICLFFFTTLISAQESHEYLGALKLNDSSLISYRITFEETDGLIRGYSITDFGGAHESKSYIAGYYDDEENILNFYESGILYTKSPITEEDFCFLHFEGELKNLNERQGIEGEFISMYDNGDPCINGEIMMANFGKILKKATKLDRKIDKSILIPKDKKEKINLVNQLDSLSMNLIKKNEIINVFTEKEEAVLSIYDAGREDGDRIRIFVNGKILLTDYTATLTKKTIRIPLTEDKTRVKVMALNNGRIGGNTVKIDIDNNSHIIETITSFQANEFAEYLFIRKK